MRILMQGRTELARGGGGDKIQINSTAKELREMGVEVDFVPKVGFNPQKYDLVHVFQLDWTPETYLYIKKAKEYNKPVVLSPIHHKVEEVKKFDDTYVFDFRRLSSLLLKDQFNRDALKNIYRSFFNVEKIWPTAVSIYMGFKKMQKKAIELSDVLLVQTALEAQDLKNTFGVDFKWKIIPNGVGEHFYNPEKYTNPLDIENYILCVGRIEPRKNQLNTIKAVEMLRNETGEDLHLVLIGGKNVRNHFEYTTRFNKTLTSRNWLHYVQEVPHSEIPAYYKFAKVCVSASWFETTGLTSLEALFMGTNAVASGPRAKEYIGEYASYCEPGNVESIKNAIKKEYYKNRPVIGDEMKTNYTWKNAARKTLEVYNDLIKEQH